MTGSFSLLFLLWRKNENVNNISDMCQEEDKILFASSRNRTTSHNTKKSIWCSSANIQKLLIFLLLLESQFARQLSASMKKIPLASNTQEALLLHLLFVLENDWWVLLLWKMSPIAKKAKSWALSVELQQRTAELCVWGFTSNLWCNLSSTELSRGFWDQSVYKIKEPTLIAKTITWCAEFHMF